MIPHLSVANKPDNTTVAAQQPVSCVPPSLEFTPTEVSAHTFSFVTIVNNFSSTCLWSLTPIAPPYCKSVSQPPHGKGITRVAYPAFVFATTSGSIDGAGTVQVKV